MPTARTSAPDQPEARSKDAEVELVSAHVRHPVKEEQHGVG